MRFHHTGCLPFRCAVLAIALPLVAVPAFAAESDPSQMDLSSGWRFKIGDDLAWSRLSLDDSDWQPIRVDRPWEDQGYANHDGYAWYRIRFRVHESLRNAPAVQQYQSLRLALGKIDDVDQTWLNGKLIGSTGRAADPYESAWFVERVYQIPLSLIRWDEHNILAVRVYDGDGNGGIYSGICNLTAPTIDDFLQIEFDLGRGDGIFSDASGLPIAVQISNATTEAVSGVVQWEIKDDEATAVATESADATIPAQGEARVTSSYRPATPGFYRVTCAFQVGSKDVAELSMTLGYRPQEIKAALTRQEDFDVFWEGTLKALAAVEPQYQMTRHANMDTKTHDVYEVEMHTLGGVRVRGWYEQPRAAGRFPAMLRVPGYGGNMKPMGRSEPMAILSFNIRGHGNSQDDVAGAPQDYWVRGLDAKEGYFYQGAYADCVRAVDFLASRPEIDGTRIVVTGGSQGGGLSLATAALDSRISLCAPDIPFLCDWVKYFKASQWPEMNAWVEAKPHRSWGATLRTLSYFDTLNMADRIQCPVFLGLGLQDDVCPAATIFAVYNRLAVSKEFSMYPHDKHSVGSSHNQKRHDWIGKHFRVEGGEQRAVK